jgi:hypothetical protein
MLLVWFVGCELMIGCARFGETFARTASDSSIALKMLQAVHVIHEKKIVHSDLGPWAVEVD